MIAGRAELRSGDARPVRHRPIDVQQYDVPARYHCSQYQYLRLVIANLARREVGDRYYLAAGKILGRVPCGKLCARSLEVPVAEVDV